MASAREALRRTFAGPAVRRSLWVAAIVGSILNLINQSGAVFEGEPLVLWRLLLTYFVPFAVASYGSYAAHRNS